MQLFTREEKISLVAAFIVIGVLWATTVYIAAHFIGKYW
jgi:hypothetical protein